MVCVLEESSVICIIHNVTSAATSVANKITLALPASTTVEELLQKLNQEFENDPDTFELLYQISGDLMVLNNHREQTLESIGVNLQPGSRNIFVVADKGGPSSRKMAIAAGDGNEDDMMLGASASPTAAGDYSPAPPAPPPPPILNAGVYTFAPALIRHEPVEYVGLVNQAMTCYLNSLLQALFMTPEFRNALYKWEYDYKESNEITSIPFQLQKLFLNLQTSPKPAVETTDLTKSFGWDSSEAWHQHDIQELCRVMFDALEQKFKNTDQADLISRLYEGKMIDYVKCLECKTEKCRDDTFLDIPLPVRPFGYSVAYSSIEEALRGFVQHELLDGNNQYFCEKCNKKCDAHKGLKFSKFPYLLTLHLKRFDFDYATLHRIKLNDRVSFPEILNLNSFIVRPDNKEENELIPEEMVVKCDDSSTTDSGSALDDESCHGTDAGLSSHDADLQEDDEGIDMGNGINLQENEKNRRHTMEKGPYMYELFSIMIHSGSASGGHYYAYIKDFKRGEWFCFNDQSVSRITNDDITKTFGGGPARGYYSGAYSSSTNAYMLMYRQIDKERNSEAMTEEQFPEHIKKLLKTMQDQEETDRRVLEREKDMFTIKLYAQLPCQTQMAESKLYCRRFLTLKEATVMAYENFNMQNVVPLEFCRLVSYDKVQNTIECSFDGKEDELLGELLDGIRSNCKHDLLLEHRKENEEFEVYRPGGVTTKVFVVDMETEELEGPITVRGNLSQTVREFKGTLSRVLRINPDEMKIVLEKYSNQPRLLEIDDNTLKSEGFYGGANKIFVAISYDEDPEKPFITSKLHQIIDRFEHVISLHVSLPEVDKDTLKKLGIPPLTLDVNHNNGGNMKQADENLDNEQPSVDVLHHFPNASANNSLSARENSPQPPCDNEDEGVGATGLSDQSTSEDSSLTDSDRTLVGDVPDECLAQLSSPSNSPPGSDQHNISSPDEREVKTIDWNQTSNWDEDDAVPADVPSISCYHYFKVAELSDPDCKKISKTLNVLVDKRMLLSTLKKDLEPYVGVPAEHFKIYRTYAGQPELECSRLNEALNTYRDGENFTIKLVRALKKGEYRGKVYQLLPNAAEPSKFLFDWVLAKWMTVGEAKKEILQELKRKYDVEIPFERCRLRKKAWKNPTKVYLDHQKFEEINLPSNWEIFVQELSGPELYNADTKLLLFVRQWCPSTYELKPFEEVFLNSLSGEELRNKLSEISGIPADKIEISKGISTFPCEVSLFQIHTSLEWSHECTQLDVWPFKIFDDGQVIFYRDSREELKELTNEEKKEISSREGSRVNRLSTVSSYSPRKERALKIYLDSSPRKRDETDLD